MVALVHDMIMREGQCQKAMALRNKEHQTPIDLARLSPNKSLLINELQDPSPTKACSLNALVCCSSPQLCLPLS